ncbi:MAG: hypothetical protein KDA71_24880, partial [Planctomycetales bacterium]|nr:hypothetical protein [Planctomycetales bacterium]
ASAAAFNFMNSVEMSAKLKDRTPVLTITPDSPFGDSRGSSYDSLSGGMTVLCLRFARHGTD